MDFETTLKQDILHNGPLSVAAFMARAAGHYYATRDPFGAGGDFTTAPEISQMFGELLGAWAADVWAQMGRPGAFTLAEAGPGRGTLMVDALRAVRCAPGFLEAAEIALIETSPALRARQEEALRGHAVTWYDRLEYLPERRPVILLANEFFDALPIRQFERREGRWHERTVGLDVAGALCFGLIPTAEEAPEGVQGDVYETCPTAQDFTHTLCRRILRDGGAALVVDYGYARGAGDTLQAVRAHRSVPVLDAPGESDITAHVDFGALAAAARGEGATVSGPVPQGAFLQRLGIGPRAAFLRRTATARQAAAIDAALRRLTERGEMGDLFKVMALCAPGIVPAGF